MRTNSYHGDNPAPSSFVTQACLLSTLCEQLGNSRVFNGASLDSLLKFSQALGWSGDLVEGGDRRMLPLPWERNLPALGQYRHEGLGYPGSFPVAAYALTSRAQTDKFITAPPALLLGNHPMGGPWNAMKHLSSCPLLGSFLKKEWRFQLLLG